MHASNKSSRTGAIININHPDMYINPRVPHRRIALAPAVHLQPDSLHHSRSTREKLQARNLALEHRVNAPAQRLCWRGHGHCLELIGFQLRVYMSSLLRYISGPSRSMQRTHGRPRWWTIPERKHDCCRWPPGMTPPIAHHTHDTEQLRSSSLGLCPASARRSRTIRLGMGIRFLALDMQQRLALQPLRSANAFGRASLSASGAATGRLLLDMLSRQPEQSRCRTFRHAARHHSNRLCSTPLCQDVDGNLLFCKLRLPPRQPSPLQQVFKNTAATCPGSCTSLADPP